MTLERAPKAASDFEAYHKRLLSEINSLQSKQPSGQDVQDVQDEADKAAAAATRSESGQPKKQ